MAWAVTRNGRRSFIASHRRLASLAAVRHPRGSALHLLITQKYLCRTTYCRVRCRTITLRLSTYVMLPTAPGYAARRATITTNIRRPALPPFRQLRTPTMIRIRIPRDPLIIMIQLTPLARLPVIGIRTWRHGGDGLSFSGRTNGGRGGKPTRAGVTYRNVFSTSSPLRAMWRRDRHNASFSCCSAHMTIRRFQPSTSLCARHGSGAHGEKQAVLPCVLLSATH